MLEFVARYKTLCDIFVSGVYLGPPRLTFAAPLTAMDVALRTEANQVQQQSSTVCFSRYEILSHFLVYDN